jgi:sugar/nucleoside kinase (ribokinase family)
MDILGIGNALLDIFGFSDEDIALALGLHPNRGAHVSGERLDELLIAVPTPILVSGGCVPNALKAAAFLGLDCAAVGCVGTEDREDDRWAKTFMEDLAESGVRTILERRTKATGRCLVLHMPGGMKSIACAPGAAPTLSAEQIDDALVSSARTVFVDGQTLRNRDVFEKITRSCGAAKVPLAIDVAAAEIVREKSAVIERLLAESGATVFLNEDEARALAVSLEKTVPLDLSGLAPRERADVIFSHYARSGSGEACIVVKRGEWGAECWTAAGKTEARTEPVRDPLDDTGAGDTFAGAFLATRLEGHTVAECLDAGNLAARACLSAPGTRLSKDDFAALARRFPRFS